MKHQLRDDLAHALHGHFELEAIGPIGCQHSKESDEEHVADFVLEQFRTDTAVDRVAGFLYHQDFSSPMSEHSSWCTNPDCDLIDGYRVDARHLINAFLGEE